MSWTGAAGAHIPSPFSFSAHQHGSQQAAPTVLWLFSLPTAVHFAEVDTLLARVLGN